MSNRQKVKIADIAEEIRVMYEPTKTERIPYVGLEHIEQQTLRLSSVGSSSEVQSTKKKFESGDILFGTLRPYFRKVVRPKFSGVCSTDISVIKAKSNTDQAFLHYLIASQEFISLANNSSNGTRMPRASWKVLLKAEWLMPQIDVQRQVGKILLAYDNLIENNNRRIAVLEEMAQSLYREWFVKFRFPGYENVRFVDSKWGLVPEGWEIQKLEALTEYINRGVAPKYSDSAAQKVINQKCIRGFKLDLDLSRALGNKIAKEKLLKYGDILINSTGVGTLGRVAQVLFTPVDTTVDSHITIVRPKRDVPIEFFGLCLESFQPYFERLGEGATGQTELKRELVGDALIIWPGQGLASIFANFVRPVRTLSYELQMKNKNLKIQRDLLLPKLISGNLQV